MHTFYDENVKAIFDAYEDSLRENLLNLRQWIFEVAASSDEMGSIEETLKWGQPSYLTVQPKTGTTLRIDLINDDRYAMFVHCQTTIVDSFRAMYPEAFEYDGTRGVILDPDGDIPLDAVKHFIYMALTYHRNK